MRILDMTQYEAGPSCTQALAWLGADVVKVERPGTGDPGRGLSKYSAMDSEYFLNWNCNKRSVTLHLDRPDGREVLLKMLPHYDVFVENYGPGVVEKLDIDYDVMKEVHPGIIYARVKGFGTSGPYSHYKCFDAVAQAAAGVMSTTGEPDGPPMRTGPTIGDVGTGIQLALAILAAYVQKQRTGVGQLIEYSMQEAVTYLMRTRLALGAPNSERPSQRTGPGEGPAMNLYACKPFGPNDYIYIMAVTPRMRKDLYKAIGRADMQEGERPTSREGWMERAEALKVAVAEWSRGYTKHEAMRIMCEGGVPASAVMDTHDLFHDPHLKARGFVQAVQHEEMGERPLLGWPARMSESQVPIQASPLRGKHTTEVLMQDLGLSEDDVRALHDDGAVDCREAGQNTE
jgi:formyl-CoA transferase